MKILLVPFRPLLTLAVAVAAAAPLAAQTLPQTRTFDVMVADSGADRLVRLADLNQNGIFKLPAGEWLEHYAVLSTDGGPAFSNPSSLAFDSRGRLYCSDTTLDIVLRTIDRDGDGKAQLAANDEWKVYIDNTNASNVTFASALTIRMGAGNVMFGTNSGGGTTPLDFVWRAEDGNGDGDCNDAGEITIVYDSTGGPVNIAVPFGLAIDPSNGDLLVSDTNPDFIYRLHDGDADGLYYTPGEVTIAYSGVQVGQPGLSNANSLAFGPDGDLYVNDATLDLILRLRDGNADGDYEDGGEATVFASQGGNPHGVPANQFGIEVDEHGRVFAVENSAGDYVVVYEDLNSDGDANDGIEVEILYDSALGSGSIDLPRALALVPAPRLSAPDQVSLNGTLTLDLKGHEGDDFQVLIGATLLGGPTPIPPHGTIGFLPVLLDLVVGTADANGEASLSFIVPPSIPTPLPVHFSAAMGKLPYRYYLSDEATVTIVP